MLLLNFLVSYVLMGFLVLLGCIRFGNMEKEEASDGMVVVLVVLMWPFLFIVGVIEGVKKAIACLYPLVNSILNGIGYVGKLAWKIAGKKEDK